MVTIADRPVDQPEQPVARAASWQVQAARAQLSTLIDEALAGRPQRITRRGRDVAVILAATEYDPLIGAAALHHGLVLATRNVQDLRHFGGLALEDPWR
jgi:prevent-host-death family protein